MSVLAEERYAAALGGVNRWTTSAEYSNDGGRNWRGLNLVSGSVTCSSVAQVRWVCEVVVTGATFGLGGVNPYQSRLRIRHALRYSPQEQPVWSNLGVYAVTDVMRSLDAPDQLTLSGQSFEHYLIRAGLAQPRTVTPNAASVLLTTLIREVLPLAKIAWDPAVDDVHLGQVLIERDRWNTIDGGSDAASIGKALSARVYPDESGIWRVAPIPALTDDPVWTAQQGVGGVLLTQSEQVSDEGVTNVQIVQGTPPGLRTIGPVYARDLDPTSPTYTQLSVDKGGFGEVPDEPYSSQLITSRRQAQKVAESRLAVRLGLKQQLSFGSLHDPTKRPGQVGILQGAGLPQRVILDSVTYDLSSAPGPLQCECRTTATRLVGDPTDPSAEDDLNAATL